MIERILEFRGRSSYMSDVPVKGAFFTPELAVVVSRSAVLTCGFVILYLTDYLYWGQIDPWVIYLWDSRNTASDVTLVKQWAFPIWWAVIAAFLLAAFETVRRPQLSRTVFLALAALFVAVVLAVMIHKALQTVLYSRPF